MALEGEMLSPKRALSKLEHYFSDSDPDRQFVVLLVDELDYMVTVFVVVIVLVGVVSFASIFYFYLFLATRRFSVIFSSQYCFFHTSTHTLS